MNKMIYYAGELTPVFGEMLIDFYSPYMAVVRVFLGVFLLAHRLRTLASLLL